MRTIQYILVLVAVGITSGILADQFVDAQEVEIAPGVKLDQNQVIIVVVIGSIAGIVRAVQGFDKSPNDFDVAIFIRSIWKSVALAVPWALGSAYMQDFTAFNLVQMFFAIAGTTDLVSRAQLKSISNNATPEQIAKILEERE